MVRSFVKTFSLLGMLVALCPIAGEAQTPAAEPCTDANHRAFDFWLGEWDVTPQNAQPNDTVVRLSSITAELGGCAIREEYSTSTGYTGTSINFYHAALGEWHQTWIDNQGAPIEMKGGIEDGKMVMRWAPREGQIARMTWTPMDDDTVRQHWETSDDGGVAWVTAFDGIYRRRGD